MRIFFFIVIGIVFLPNVNYAVTHVPSISATEPERRALPAPYDAIFPSKEFLGPTIGVPNTDPIYPLNTFVWKNFKTLEKEDIRIYGWVNPSYNVSSSKNSNIPLSYTIVPNQVELEQLVLRMERVPDTVQTQNTDWGFRISNMFGIDYRYTTAQGIMSSQLLQQNNLYGYDPVEAYTQLYIPTVAQGMLITLGRYISPVDIEAQLAPQNYLITHSLMFTYDTYTQSGINTAIKFNNTWTMLLGLHSGSDMAPWAAGAHIPTFQALLRWVSGDNKDSLWGGMDSINDGQFRGNHDNLQQFNLTWSHQFTSRFFTQTEAYYLYQFNAAKGGSCNFGPIRSFGGGGGCGPTIPGRANVFGIVNYTELKTSEKDFFSFRTDYLGDYQGQRTGFATPYMSWTLGVTHQFSPLLEVRPEVRYEFAFKGTPYNNGTRNDQSLFLIDAILRY